MDPRLLAAVYEVGNLAGIMIGQDLNSKVLIIAALSGAVFGLITFLLVDNVGRRPVNDFPAPTALAAESEDGDQNGSGLAVITTPSLVVDQSAQPTALIATYTPESQIDPPILATPDEGALLHTVQAGENIFRISLRYGVPIDEIMVANRLADSSLITAGQVLVIPTSDASTAPTAPIAEVPVLGTPTPSITPSPTITPTATSTPTPPPPSQVNGISIDSFVVMSPEVIANAKEIFAKGQELGINPRAFSKVGDSTIENPHFLARFDVGPYDLADYGHLQAAIDYFSGSHARQGMAVRRGFHSWTVTDPMWANKEFCLPNETPVACEIRINRPALLFIRLGSNDAGVPGSFDFNVRLVVEYAIDQGVIPIIGTKADRFEGDGNINNDILRQIAYDYQLPLWDFDLVSATIPNRGLYQDDVHLTIFFAHDYNQSLAFQSGHGVHNLTALLMLDAILDTVIEPAGE